MTESLASCHRHFDPQPMFLPGVLALLQVQAVTGKGYDAILSSPWYLNLGTYGGQDWKRYYSVDPTDFSGTPEQVWGCSTGT